jgi:hypothetical protein
MAIVSALEYNTFFRGLKVSHTRLSNDTLERILHVMKRSMWLEELHLEGLGLKADFIHKLAVSVISNNNPALKTIDLNHNLIEDKGERNRFRWFDIETIFLFLFNFVDRNANGVRRFITVCPDWKTSTRFA